MATAYTKFDECLKNSSLPANSKLVLAQLIDLRKVTDHPKIETLARKLGICPKTVKNAIRRLRGRGLITAIKGQRQNSYRIASGWETLLRGKSYPAEPIPAGQKLPRARGKSYPAEPRSPYYLSDSFNRTDKEGNRDTPTKLSTRADLAGTLALCRDLYDRLGVPFNEQLCLQLMLSYPPDEQARMPQRLPDFIKYQIVTGRWPNPAKTKSLENLLRDKSWNCELPPLRTLPEPRKPTLAEQQKQLYFARARAKASAQR